MSPQTKTKAGASFKAGVNRGSIVSIINSVREIFLFGMYI
jgi:hypothetical protein